MPEYSHIQTYVKCNKDNYNTILNQFACVLSELGFDKEFLSECFNGLEWEISDNGFMYVGSNIKTVEIELFGLSLHIKPNVLGWTPEVIKQLKEPWLEISLTFETNEIENSEFKIKNDAKIPLWNTMQRLSWQFHETGTYLTDEVTDGVPWQALLGFNNDIWSFDAAIIPIHLAKYYGDLNKNYSTINDVNRIYLVNKNTWGEAPLY